MKGGLRFEGEEIVNAGWFLAHVGFLFFLIFFFRSGKINWEKKYAVLEAGNLSIYEHEPKNSQLAPIMKWNLRPDDGHVVIGEAVENSDLLNTAKSDLPYIIKVNAGCLPLLYLLYSSYKIKRIRNLF